MLLILLVCMCCPLPLCCPLKLLQRTQALAILRGRGSGRVWSLGTKVHILTPIHVVGLK